MEGLEMLPPPPPRSGISVVKSQGSDMSGDPSLPSLLSGVALKC